jgi:3-hydroxyisobutyrate dehydrogenase-like beta-hydroxyacid dehydrogenase
MSLRTVAVVAQGDMGAGTGGQLARNGLNVITNLTGRSSRSCALAGQADMNDVGDDAALVRDADMFLSILPPGEAIGLARRMAPHIRASGKPILYVDCNAVAPTTKAQIGTIAEEAGDKEFDPVLRVGAACRCVRRARETRPQRDRMRRPDWPRGGDQDVFRGNDQDDGRRCC